MSRDQTLAHRYKETAIKTANPLQLVVILYDSAIQYLKEAQQQIERKDIAGRSHSINRSMAIISQLQASLNLEEGGEIARSLDRLYDYVRREIMLAGVEQNVQPLSEVVCLLENLRSAWSKLVIQSQTAALPANSAELSRPGVPGGSPSIPSNSLNISG